MCGCGKKEEEPEQTDEILTAVTVTDLVPGSFYVKSGESYYLLPLEDANFDSNKQVISSDNSPNGIIVEEPNRLIDFVYKDMAIPTLYRNDQLIFVTNTAVSSFSWERFLDLGYSIGLSNLLLEDSGKIKSTDKTHVSAGSTMESIMSLLTIPEGADLTINAINGTALTERYLNEGIVTGMSKDAIANLDLYIGTQHIPATGSADTRYFKSIELFQTEKYTLSPDGYAVLEVPSYFKSGFYLLNGIGFVKFLNIDRGIDESGIDLTIPYYYKDKDGKTLTFYEWQELNGELPLGKAPSTNSKEIDIIDYNERYSVQLDRNQEQMTISVNYKFLNDEYRADAGKTGRFPKVILLDPTGISRQLVQDETATYSSENQENNICLKIEVDDPVPGEWNILYQNFEYTYKTVDIDINSGNATSYLHNSSSGFIDIYFDASPDAHDFIVTWEHADRAAKEIKITAPDGTIYSKDKTPGNVMADEYGRQVLKVPELLSGTYKFEIKGDSLGRVWVDTETSVSLNTGQVINHSDVTADVQEDDITENELEEWH